MHGEHPILTRRWLKLTDEAVAAGMTNAARGLSEMIGRDVHIHHVGAQLVAYTEAIDRLGGAERAVCAVYPGMTGDLDGEVALLFDQRGARRWMELVLGEPAGAPAAEMARVEQSALGEMGSITGSLFMKLAGGALPPADQPDAPLHRARHGRLRTGRHRGGPSPGRRSGVADAHGARDRGS